MAFASKQDRRQDRRYRNELWIELDGVSTLPLGGMMLRPGVPNISSSEAHLAKLSRERGGDNRHGESDHRPPIAETGIRFVGISGEAYDMQQRGGRRRGAAAVRTTPPSVLLVEDGADMAKLYQTYLETEGYVVEVADSIFNAWEWVQCTRPDVTVIDLGLPDGSGFDLLSALRDHRIVADAIVIRSNTARRAADLGVQSFLTKPVAPKRPLPRPWRALSRTWPDKAEEP